MIRQLKFETDEGYIHRWLNNETIHDTFEDLRADNTTCIDYATLEAFLNATKHHLIYSE